jgi:hemoglobin
MSTPGSIEKSLYERLGGYDAIEAATNDLLERLFRDPQLGAYWKGKGEDGKKRDIQLISNYMVAAAGGPMHYVGRDMKLSHKGLGITEGEWEIFMRHARGMLEKFNVPARETDEVLAFFTSLKADIVEKV